MLVQVKTITLIVAVLSAWSLYAGLSCNKSAGAMAALNLIGDTSKPAVSATGAASYLALGDSYTIGQSVTASDRYAGQVAKLLQADHTVRTVLQDPEIIATTGWTTGDLLNAMQSRVEAVNSGARPYRIVSVLIGVNDQYQGRSIQNYKAGFTRVLHEAVTLAGNTSGHVLVLSIPDYSVTPFAQNLDKSSIAAQIDSFNAINYQITQSLHAHYLDITQESRKAAADPSLLAADGLHFSGKEYAIWAAMMKPVIEEMLQP